MSVWVKICGNTSFEDALLAAEAGADAVGFVFASSPRRVTMEQVAAISPRLPSSIEKIGVFVDSSFDEIERTVRECGLTGVQLHWDGAEDLPHRLRERFGPGVRILPVLHYAPGVAEKIGVLTGSDSAGSDSIDAVLIDSRTATAVGGTGTSFDWDAAESVFLGASGRLIVAGGLTPSNVAEAVRKLRPWGVDVVSGVEIIPGRKNPAKVRAFLKNAR
jgi:phosphoribosylanthranilate isomerase